MTDDKRVLNEATKKLHRMILICMVIAGGLFVLSIFSFGAAFIRPLVLRSTLQFKDVLISVALFAVSCIAMQGADWVMEAIP